jgi:hypothetical protein
MPMVEQEESLPSARSGRQMVVWQQGKEWKPKKILKKNDRTQELIENKGLNFLEWAKRTGF